MVKTVTDQSFEQEILKNDKPIVVDFWASWCGPCQMMAPILEQVAQDLEGKIDFAKVDVEQNTQFAQQFNIVSIPNLVIFKNGQVVDQIVGLQQAEVLKERLLKLVEES